MHIESTYFCIEVVNMAFCIRSRNLMTLHAARKLHHFRRDSGDKDLLSLFVKV